MSPHPEGKELLSRLDGMGDHGVPVKARYFDSTKVTRQILEKEQVETERIKVRVRIQTGWSAASTDDLVRVLESGAYSYPMARDHDSHFIVAHLWRLHRDELTQDVQRRLHALIGSRLLSDRASRNLHAYLLALRGDEQMLLGLWAPGQLANLAETESLMECFSHTNTQEPTVIEDLIRIVETADFRFEPRFQAMMTLGRLDSARQTRAANAIRTSVYDSTPGIIAARSRVLARLSSSPVEWGRCPKCSYGWTNGANGCGESECPNCFGLGLLRIA